MNLIDRIKAAGTKLELELGPNVQKVSVIIEQKAAAAETAIKNAVTPEIEAEWAKVEAAIASHADALAALVKANATTASAATAPVL